MKKQADKKLTFNEWQEYINKTIRQIKYGKVFEVVQNAKNV